MLDHNRPHDGRLLRNFKFASSMDMFGIICESLWEQHNEGDVDLLLAEETEAFKTDESAATPQAPPVSPQTTVPFAQTRLCRAQISVRPHTPPSPSVEARIAEYAATPTPLSPPPSPLSPLSSLLPRILSPPLRTSLTYVEAPLGYRAAMIQLRATLPLPVPSPPLLLPSADHKSDILKTDMPFQKRLCLTALASRVDYKFIDTMDASIRDSKSRAMTAMKEDAQDNRALLRGQIFLLTREREREDRSMALEASIRTLEAQVRTLQTQHNKMEWQRQHACDMVTSAFRRIRVLEARDRAHPDDLKDIDSSC
ncbi:hypothetical protein Tco_0359052 [Tanacetum coccineum]